MCLLIFFVNEMIQFASVLPSCLASIHPPEVIVFLIQRHRDQLLAAPRYILRRNPKHKWLGGWNNKKTPSFWLFVGPYVEISGCVLLFFCLLVWVFFGLKCCWKTKRKSTKKTQPKLVNNIPFGVNKGFVTWSCILTRTSQESFDLKHAKIW